MQSVTPVTQKIKSYKKYGGLNINLEISSILHTAKRHDLSPLCVKPCKELTTENPRYNYPLKVNPHSTLTSSIMASSIGCVCMNIIISKLYFSSGCTRRKSILKNRDFHISLSQQKASSIDTVHSPPFPQSNKINLQK